MEGKTSRTWTVHSAAGIHVNRIKTFRQLLASLLRDVADAIDRRESLAIEVVTTPRLPRATVKACLLHGFDAARSHLFVEAKAAALDNVLRFKSPELFQEEGTNQ